MKLAVAAAGVPEARVSDCSSRFWYWKSVAFPFGSVIVVEPPAAEAGLPLYAQVVFRASGSVCETTRLDGSYVFVVTPPRGSVIERSRWAASYENDQWPPAGSVAVTRFPAASYANDSVLPAGSVTLAIRVPE